MVFGALAKEAPNMGKPFQLFLSFFRKDAGQDAVYIHTQNPNSEFPAEFDEFQWGVPALEAHLSKLLPQYQFIAGKRDQSYVVFAKGVGVPLSKSINA